MAIFRRKAKDDADDSAVVSDATELDESVEGETDEVDADASVDESDDAEADEAAEDDAPDRLPRPFDLDRTDGPFDESEVDDLDSRLAFGSIAIIPEATMELRLDVDDSGTEITGMTAVQGESACQLQVFAAPKTSGVWDSIRDEIADNLIAGGGTAEEKLGPLGIELHARMPARGADGRTTYSPARFVGVDGPRWFLRAVLSGRAAVDDAAGEPLIAFIRRTVVIRGSQARAPRELLPLSIPDEVAAQQPEVDPNAAPDHLQDKSDTVEDFKPFERGPEITEVR